MKVLGVLIEDNRFFCSFFIIENLMYKVTIIYRHLRGYKTFNSKIMLVPQYYIQITIYTNMCG